jgi:hypothetical protein
MLLDPRRALLCLASLAFAVLLGCSGATSSIGSAGGDASASASADASPGDAASGNPSSGDGGSHPATDGSGGGTSDGAPAGGCAAVGASCSDKSECCSAYCSAGACQCNSSGYACTTDQDCCVGLGCQNGVCGNDNPNAVIPCQACGDDAGTCPGGAEYCQGAIALDQETYCAPDCSKNPNVCAPDMPCTPLYDDMGNATGKSGCIASSMSCSAPDGGAKCDVLCAGYGAACPCGGYTCTQDNNDFYCLQCTGSPPDQICTK